MNLPSLSKNKPPFGPVKQTVVQYVAENYCECSFDVKPDACPIHAYHHIRGMVVHPSEIKPTSPLKGPGIIKSIFNKIIGKSS